VFFDIGFGNSVFVKTTTKDILIDAGPPGPPGWSPVETAILPSLTKYKVKALDALILTSLKPQCIGGAEYLLEHFPTKAIYLPSNFVDVSTMTYYEFLENLGLWRWYHDPYNYEATGLYITMYRFSRFLRNYHGDVRVIKGPQVLFEEKVSKGKFRLEVIAAGVSSRGGVDEIGDKSFGIKLSYGDSSVLILPQLSLSLQKEVCRRYGSRLKSDVLLVPQNGNIDAFAECLLKLVKPKIAICQYGWTNQRIGYFYPSVVLPTLKKYEIFVIKVYRTDITGAVTIDFVGEGYKLSTVIPKEEYEAKL